MSGAQQRSAAGCYSYLRLELRRAFQVISAFHRRFPKSFTPTVVGLFASTLAAPSRSALALLAPEQRDKEESARISRQRPVLRVCSELALVGIIKDGPERSGGEWIMKTVKELVRDLCYNDESNRILTVS
jgi:regulator of nonsense transcripts 2